MIEPVDFDWKALHRAANAWEVETSSDLMTNTESYVKFMLEEYGIHHGLTGIKVVDEKKYMVFLLRWS